MGLGFYDNEAECYVYDDDHFNGEWYVDDEGMLYIIPNFGDDIDGPDNKTAAALLKVYQKAAEMRPRAAADFIAKEVERLGLREVVKVLRRFTPEDGYFTA